ncbi:MAG TPA: biotin--[acetyl-CoA-carboxylase] ligase [Polyangiaceae bacterium]
MIVPTRGISRELKDAPAHVDARGGALGRPMRLLATTTSTSDEAKRAAKQDAPHGATWVAEEQTAGRGRQGRSWWAPAGESLLFSVLVRYAYPPARLPQIALLAGLAVFDAVAKAAPAAKVQLKWPNDVLVDGKKIGGVLVEAITSGARVEAVVIGVGVNVHTRVFPPAIAERSTSIALAGGPGAATPDRGVVLADTLAGIDHDLHVVAARGLSLLRARLEAGDVLRGRRVRSDGGDEGVGTGIDDEGRLLIRRDDGRIVPWVAGEVHLV